MLFQLKDAQGLTNILEFQQVGGALVARIKNANGGVVANVTITVADFLAVARALSTGVI